MFSITSVVNRIKQLQKEYFNSGTHYLLLIKLYL